MGYRNAQLAECLKQVERDDTIRCLLLTGAGRGFCAGQDLNDRNVEIGPSGKKACITGNHTDRNAAIGS
ncbi:enoyl-CoA hydratase/isomerase family protein, partial [Escherichia sp. SS-MK2]